MSSAGNLISDLSGIANNLSRLNSGAPVSPAQAAAWKSQLQPASFRGVPFHYSDTRREGGRRVAVNEIPFRNDGYTEDLGKRTKTHRISGFILGLDYFSARDALETALDADGPATLVHPYKGNLTVACPNYSIAETIEEGGMARFDMTFVESGAQPSPTSKAATASQAASAATSHSSLLSSLFGSAYNLNNLQGFIQDALNGNVTGLAQDLTGLLGQFGLGSPGLTGLVEGIVAAVNDGEALGDCVAAFFQGYCAAAVSAQPATGLNAAVPAGAGVVTGTGSSALPIWGTSDPNFTSRGVTPPADPSFGLAAFATWGDDLPPVVGASAQRLQQQADQEAFVSLVQGQAVAALVQLYANTQFASAADAESARDQITCMIDAQATVAGDAGDDLAYQGWETVYTAAAVDLTTRAQQLPQILNLTFASSLPALALAQRIYQDATQAPELIARNAAPHPLFMPKVLEAIAP